MDVKLAIFPDRVKIQRADWLSIPLIFYFLDLLLTKLAFTGGFSCIRKHPPADISPQADIQSFLFHLHNKRYSLCSGFIIFCSGCFYFDPDLVSPLLQTLLKDHLAGLFTDYNVLISEYLRIRQGAFSFFQSCDNIGNPKRLSLCF